MSSSYLPFWTSIWHGKSRIVAKNGSQGAWAASLAEVRFIKLVSAGYHVEALRGRRLATEWSDGQSGSWDHGSAYKRNEDFGGLRTRVSKETFGGNLPVRVGRRQASV